MIDTHCHLLPGLDDGARSDEEMLALAEQLAAAGVTRVVCTPHLSRTFPTPRELAEERLDSARRLLASAGVRLTLDLAAEVGPAWAVGEPVEALRSRSIAGRFCLVEMQPDTPAVFAPATTARLADERLGIVLAHPERSRGIQRQPFLLDEARSAGALVQIVAPSLLGRWGGAVAATAWGLLGDGRVDLVASDAHRARARSSLVEAKRLVTSRYGDSAWRELTETVPAAVVSGRRPDERGEAALERGRKDG